MKTFKFIAAFFFLAMISACVDMEENIVIHEDNSGVYTISMDMGKMMKMINQMGGGNSSEMKALENLDSTVYLKESVLATDSLTAAEKELYKESFIHIHSDEAKEQMKITMTCPFKMLSQLPEIKENFFKALDKLKAFEKIAGKASDPEIQKDTETPGKVLTPGSNNNYTFTAVPGKITNTVINAEGFKKELLSDSTMIAMQQLTAMMGEMTYKTTITAPREIKKYSGNNAELSGDKKMVIFKNTLTEMIEHPEKLEYQVEY